jgi:hypothetical protein
MQHLDAAEMLNVDAASGRSRCSGGAGAAGLNAQAAVTKSTEACCSINILTKQERAAGPKAQAQLACSRSSMLQLIQLVQRCALVRVALGAC